MIKKIMNSIKAKINQYVYCLKNGDLATKLSSLIMGYGNFTKGQIVKGVAYLTTQIIFILFMIFRGFNYIVGLRTLGTVGQTRIFDEVRGIYVVYPGDNSMLMLLFGVATLFAVLGFALLYLSNIKSAYANQITIQKGLKPRNFKEEINYYLNDKYHVTILTIPVVGTFLFTILPLIFMILIAFTNFDKNHQPPGNLFTWVGFANFKDALWNDPLKSSTFFGLLTWTLIWAVLATVLNYILGMILALMINKKGIKLKKFWRTIFVITIAVPQFVSLLLMSQLLADQGTFNVFLRQIGVVKDFFPFLSNGDVAKFTVIVVNLWVGVPYSMLITSGILMNIPTDLYESAKIDGANARVQFFKITLPYMLFVTGPYLITQFIGNINNFNVIYLLTGGGPLTLNYYQAGKTDLLVTWLYKLTVNEQNYSLASTIGIFIFMLSAFFSLVVYNKTSAAKKEDEFQ